ncbi:coil containing protein [Caudoviricetes sp.]|nr:coil containing protein [Caudoviricetes sp.]
MCYVAVAMLALTAISGAMTIAGQQQQARAVQKANEYNAQIARNNAIKAEENVRKTQLEGMKQEEAQRIKTANLLGEQKAGFGASGVMLNSGSALDVQASTAYMGQEDLLSIRTNNQAQQDRLRQQGADFTNQSNLLITEGKNARVSANYQSLATGFSTASSMLGTANSMGMFKSGSGA